MTWNKHFPEMYKRYIPMHPSYSYATAQWFLSKRVVKFLAMMELLQVLSYYAWSSLLYIPGILTSFVQFTFPIRHVSIFTFTSMPINNCFRRSLPSLASRPETPTIISFPNEICTDWFVPNKLVMHHETNLALFVHHSVPKRPSGSRKNTLPMVAVEPWFPALWGRRLSYGAIRTWYS